MIVIVRNKVFSLTGSSTVKDEAGKDVYRVKGKLRLFSPTRKKKIYDMDKKLLYVVRNKWFNCFLHRAFIFDGHKNKICTLKNQIRVKGKKFIVENKYNYWYNIPIFFTDEELRANTHNVAPEYNLGRHIKIR